MAAEAPASMGAMRCPHCVGEIPAGSRFCGICGRSITPAMGGAHAAVDAGRWAAGQAHPSGPPPPSPADSISLFEMPASRTARRGKLALVLVLDAILAGAGVVMLLAYLDARRVGRPAAATSETAPAASDAGASRPSTGATPPRAVDEAAAPSEPTEAPKPPSPKPKSKPRGRPGARPPAPRTGKSDVGAAHPAGARLARVAPK